MAILTYQVRDKAGSVFSILKLSEKDQSWIDVKGDASLLNASQGTVSKGGGSGLFCKSGSETIIQLVNASWEDEVGISNEARCRGCRIGCEPEPRWTCTSRE